MITYWVQEALLQIEYLCTLIDWVLMYFYRYPITYLGITKATIATI